MMLIHMLKGKIMELKELLLEMMDRYSIQMIIIIHLRKSNKKGKEYGL